MTYLPYAGIGSRQTPKLVLDLMQRIGSELARNGFTLRSGGAVGADTAFEEGAVSVQYSGATVSNAPALLASAGTEIFLPWDNFNGRKYGIVPFQNEYAEEAMKIAEAYHPNWKACSKGAKLLHTRNVAQVLGHDLKSPSKFIVCWTEGGKGGGGTGQALRIAKGFNIPIFDLGFEPANTAQALATYCEYLIHPEIADPH